MELIYSRRKSVQVKLIRPELIELRAPKGYELDHLISFLNSRMDWILKRRDDLQNSPRSLKELKFHNQTYKLGELVEFERLSSFERIFYNEGQKFLEERLEFWKSELPEYKVGKLSFRAMKSRWGSCSVRGDITLNRFLFALPAEIIDLVIVHEMVHTKEFDHGKVFYQRLNSHINDRPAKEKSLKTWSTILG